MTESFSLVARLAANLLVDAINLAKPGARLAAKIGDRVLNAWPSPDRCRVCGSYGYCYMPDRCPKLDGELTEAEESNESWEAGELNDDPSERLVKCSSPTCGCQDDDRYEQADYEVGCYKPDLLWSAARVREQEEDRFVSVARIAQIATAATNGFSGEWQFTAVEQDLLDIKPGDAFCGGIVGLPTDNPAGAADLEPGAGGAHKPCAACDYSDNGWCPCECHEAAPGLASPVEQAPSPAAPPAAGSGALGELTELITEVLSDHLPEGDADGAWHSVRCYNPQAIATLHKVCKDWREWHEHVAPIVAERIAKATPPAPFTFGDLTEAGRIVSFYADEFAMHGSDEQKRLHKLADRLIDAGLADPNP